MKITVRIKLNKSKEGVEKISETEFVVYTKKPAVEGKANEDIVKQLASYFKVSKTNSYIVKGAKSKTKVIEIRDKK